MVVVVVVVVAVAVAVAAGDPGHFGTHDKSHFGTHREVSVKGHFGTQREPDKDQFGTHTDLWNTRGLGGVWGVGGMIPFMCLELLPPLRSTKQWSP